MQFNIFGVEIKMQPMAFIQLPKSSNWHGHTMPSTSEQ